MRPVTILGNTMDPTLVRRVRRLGHIVLRVVTVVDYLVTLVLGFSGLVLTLLGLWALTQGSRGAVGTLAVAAIFLMAACFYARDIITRTRKEREAVYDRD
jgi:uncharacterized membrane protein